MQVFNVRNVHHALPVAVKYLRQNGIRRNSRNGWVTKARGPVTTVYHYPLERVMLWPERNANPFFHLYESLWMLAGRNDLAPLVKYAPNMANYSDDGITLHGAYGHRWRQAMSHANSGGAPADQLAVIAGRLYNDPDDRRCVLQMWRPMVDMGYDGKDVPCNTTATFQIDEDNKLDLCVFCRSNDIIWGAYGANAVHFSMLQEYMAHWIGAPVGRMYQISVNWHAYDQMLEGIKMLAGQVDVAGYTDNPYASGGKIEITGMSDGNRHYLEGPLMQPVPMPSIPHDDLDRQIQILLAHADSDSMEDATVYQEHPWLHVCYTVLLAHQVYRNKREDGSHYKLALEVLDSGPHQADWIVAARQWMLRRYHAWHEKQDYIIR